jgi:hypothetical protein
LLLEPDRCFECLELTQALCRATSSLAPLREASLPAAG